MSQHWIEFCWTMKERIWISHVISEIKFQSLHPEIFLRILVYLVAGEIVFQPRHPESDVPLHDERIFLVVNGGKLRHCLAQCWKELVKF